MIDLNAFKKQVELNKTKDDIEKINKDKKSKMIAELQIREQEIIGHAMPISHHLTSALLEE